MCFISMCYFSVLRDFLSHTINHTKDLCGWKIPGKLIVRKTQETKTINCIFLNKLNVVNSFFMFQFKSGLL
jgi:hypothetical protein